MSAGNGKGVRIEFDDENDINVGGTNAAVGKKILCFVFYKFGLYLMALDTRVFICGRGTTSLLKDQLSDEDSFSVFVPCCNAGIKAFLAPLNQSQTRVKSFP